MTLEQHQQWILAQINEIAETQYPNRKELQSQFKIGFLTAQLAQAQYRDSYYTEAFRDRVRELGYTQKTNNKQ